MNLTWLILVAIGVTVDVLAITFALSFSRTVNSMKDGWLFIVYMEVFSLLFFFAGHYLSSFWVQDYSSLIHVSGGIALILMGALSFTSSTANFGAQNSIRKCISLSAAMSLDVGIVGLARLVGDADRLSFVFLLTTATLVFSLLGISMGKRLSAPLVKNPESAGGVILLALGIARLLSPVIHAG